ncbi:Hypothetical predicted protein [Cloeon dipterum]|uniref:Uncharacterized protein n=1 Tax=Cloeon dipterum TaxID=197152 RepID=A0A8S1DTM8_9INSE|nr:Hypothetical predicted protein [Cloeon dipterum]
MPSGLPNRAVATLVLGAGNNPPARQVEAPPISAEQKLSIAHFLVATVLPPDSIRRLGGARNRGCWALMS